MTPSYNRFSLKKRLKSFIFAFNGLRRLLVEEHNSRIHLVISIAVATLGFIIELSAIEWIAIVLAIGFVFVSELLNSSIESIADFISPEKHDQIMKIKDYAAGAVLIAAIVACIVGLIIFLPKLI